MLSVKSKKIPIVLANRVSGYIAISLLPIQHSKDIVPPLIEEPLTSSPDHELSIQLLNNSEYRYQINVEGFVAQPGLHRPENFSGRHRERPNRELRAKFYTGWSPQFSEMMSREHYKLGGSNQES